MITAQPQHTMTTAEVVDGKILVPLDPQPGRECHSFSKVRPNSVHAWGCNIQLWNLWGKKFWDLPLGPIGSTVFSGGKTYVVDGYEVKRVDRPEIGDNPWTFIVSVKEETA